MSNMLDIVRKIVRKEMESLMVMEVGEVTSVYPHSSNGDKDNYQCNVRLRDRGVELRRVPVATQHIGLANIPHVGDMVLVAFIQGNINAPVIVGRLYNEEDRPPTSREEEIIYKPPYRRNPQLKRIYVELPSGISITIKDDEVDIKLNRASLNIKDNGNVKISARGSITIEAGGAVNISSRTKINLKAPQIVSEARTNMELKSNLQTKIESNIMQIQGGALVEIKGGLIKLN